MKIKGGGHKLDLVLIVIGLLLLDALIYLLLELLLDGYSPPRYGQGSGSFPNENINSHKSLVLSSIYVWHTVNLTVMLIMACGMVTKRRQRRFKTKRVSTE